MYCNSLNQKKKHKIFKEIEMKPRAKTVNYAFFPQHFECGNCGKIFKTELALKLHTKVTHKGVLPSNVKCKKCDSEMPRKEIGKHISTFHKKGVV